VRSDPDYWKLNLLVDLFGGADSLVYKRLRDDLGLVYSTGFFQPYRWQAGMVMGYIGCKGDQTAAAILETVKLMQDLRTSVPADLFEINRQDSLNSFVFNVDTPADLVNVYGRYALRDEPLNTLDNIQEQFISATTDDMTRLAQKWLDPAKLQIVVVGDKTIPVIDENGTTMTLEDALKNTAQTLNLAFKEVALR
jgi:zinc protease